MKLVKIIVTLSFLVICYTGLSQLGNPIIPFGGIEPCANPFDPCPVPLDGGVSILIAAGLAYGGKKLHDRNSSDISK